MRKNDVRLKFHDHPLDKTGERALRGECDSIREAIPKRLAVEGIGDSEVVEPPEFGDDVVPKCTDKPAVDTDPGELGQHGVSDRSIASDEEGECGPADAI
ncbi:MAG TPA: hypothetical protein VF713_15015 [Thermoanaerobaculia bacterium]